MGCCHSHPGFHTDAAAVLSFRAGLIRHWRGVSVWDIYDKVTTLGEGMVGPVFLVRNRLTAQDFALKGIRYDAIDVDSLEDLRREIELLHVVRVSVSSNSGLRTEGTLWEELLRRFLSRQLDHPNIIRLYESYEDETGLYLVLEYCSGGDLLQYLQRRCQRRHQLTEDEVARLVLMMTTAIAYCHRNAISHRDIKLDNFLFETTSPGSFLKLTDFGLSKRYMSGGEVLRMRSSVGTPSYVAPEVARPRTESRLYSQVCDVWSLGVVTYILLSGRAPFAGPDARATLGAVVRGKFSFRGKRWKHVSEDAKNFVRRCLTYNPEERPQAEELLADPWVEAAQQRRREEGAHCRLDRRVIGNICQFAEFSPLKKAAIQAIAMTLSVRAASALRDQFELLDANNDGLISVEELRAALQDETDVSVETVARIFAGIEDANPGFISYSEFLAAALDREVYTKGSHACEAFRRFDVDTTGYITREDLKEVLGTNYSAARVEQMMLEGDVYRNGRIDFSSFLDVLRGQQTTGLETDALTWPEEGSVSAETQSLLPVERRLHEPAEPMAWFGEAPARVRGYRKVGDSWGAAATADDIELEDEDPN